MRVVVIGAGVGGLAAAHHLRHLASSRGGGLELEVVVLESTERAGGVAGTESFEGALLERGPDTLVTHKPAGVALCRRLGLELTHPPSGRSQILHRGRLVAVPDGMALFLPTRRWPLVTSPLLSWRGKLRALREPGVPPGVEADESVASFVRRRFGAEVHDHLAEPIAGAIYMADTERLSLAAVAPRLLIRERERERGRGQVGDARPSDPQAPPQLAALRGGLGQLTGALAAALPSGALRLKTRAERLLRDDSGLMIDIDGHLLRADGVLLAVPAHDGAALTRDLDPRLAALLREILYTSCVTVNLAWPRPAPAGPPASHGFFVPRSAGLPLLAAGFVDAKFPERVPAGQMVVRAFFGGALHADSAELPDGDVATLAAAILGPLVGRRQPPIWSRVFRHARAMPHPAVGHAGLADRVRGRLAHQPGLELAGGPLGAYGVADSIAAAETAAQRLFAQLSSRPEMVQK